MATSAEVKQRLKPYGYPKLMISKDRQDLILFRSKSIGTVIESNHHEVGYMSNCWVSEDFEDFQGVVVLENAE